MMALLLGFVIAVAALFIAVRWLEGRVVYYPSTIIAQTPAAAGLKFEDVAFVSQDGTRLHGWFVPVSAARGNILFCHGNAGNIGDRVVKLEFFHELGFNVFIFDYRGYGRSRGKPSELGFYRDGRAAYDTLMARDDVKGLPVVLFGESIGGAVASELALSRHAAALVTEETFSSMEDMARVHFPWAPVMMLSLKFDTQGMMARAVCPKLVMHSPQDEIVPFALAQKLFAAAAAPKEFLEVAGGHNEAFFMSLPRVRQALEDLLRKYQIG